MASGAFISVPQSWTFPSVWILIYGSDEKFNEKFQAWLVIHVANKRSFYDAEERCEKTKLKKQIFKLES